MGDSTTDTHNDEKKAFSSPSPSPTAVDAAAHEEGPAAVRHNKYTSSSLVVPRLKPNRQSSDSLVAVGCLFENNLATTSRHFSWILREGNRIHNSICTNDQPNEKPGPEHAQQQRVVRVALHHIADNDPGALQSGHYLWPAAEMLAEYLIHTGNNNNKQTRSRIESVLELGAGCALPTLVALQVWQRTIQCLIVTDHDATVLQRAVDNHESTLEAILNASVSDTELNAAISCVGSIPVLFEKLEWTTTRNKSNNEDQLQSIREQLMEHTTSQSDTVDIVLGSDLIDHIPVVAPLLETAVQLMHPTHGRFWLAQSFTNNDELEQEICTVCQRLGLVRRALWPEENADSGQNTCSGGGRIQEFSFASAAAKGPRDVAQQAEAALKQDDAMGSDTMDENERQNDDADKQAKPSKDLDLDDD